MGACQRAGGVLVAVFSPSTEAWRRGSQCPAVSQFAKKGILRKSAPKELSLVNASFLPTEKKTFFCPTVPQNLKVRFFVGVALPKTVGPGPELILCLGFVCFCAKPLPLFGSEPHHTTRQCTYHEGRMSVLASHSNFAARRSKELPRHCWALAQGGRPA